MICWICSCVRGGGAGLLTEGVLLVHGMYFLLADVHEAVGQSIRSRYACSVFRVFVGRCLIGGMIAFQC